MIKTITLASGETLTLKNSLGYKVRYQNAFGKPCDQALIELEKAKDPMVLIEVAYCMATPRPATDFEGFADTLEGADLLTVSQAVLELYADGMPSEKQVKKAKN